MAPVHELQLDPLQRAKWIKYSAMDAKATHELYCALKVVSLCFVLRPWSGLWTVLSMPPQQGALTADHRHDDTSTRGRIELRPGCSRRIWGHNTRRCRVI